MNISKEKLQQLEKRMAQLDINENNIIEKFILGQGAGGQKINKTSSCVYLKHIPTNTQVKCQKDRSREMNRYFARKELCDKIEAREKGILSEKMQLIAKIRRQKKRRSRKSKEKMLVNKKAHSDKKSFRQTPHRD